MRTLYVQQQSHYGIVGKHPFGVGFGSFIPNGENRPLVLSSDVCDHGFVSVAYSAITCCLMKARKTCACVRIATTYAESTRDTVAMRITAHN
ncbi:hypothetical protein T11_1218 [Trichinella zimbabwensis]|uniref:Uncharacterized protein n=1 Tax=Trichinella zimbabwensis TaxID=268475 RepID=A0A0V1GSB4_9BILA|nr:hypothetical protein T11_7967 [Trichinella zimbabwensis]KRZ01274.1 hypothetical protein T11_11114 [Trichinella zimbabwensis]KRZ02993.1 hypothetical protein T11_15165 [Trichinella zimbabwensis]KRZ06137.1 hypothetical protein T11_1218 [Trichinella zimbabwensis]